MDKVDNIYTSMGNFSRMWKSLNLIEMVEMRNTISYMKFFYGFINDLDTVEL